MSYRIQTCNSLPFGGVMLFYGNKLILFFFLILSMAVAQQGKPTVAILDFTILLY